VKKLLANNSVKIRHTGTQNLTCYHAGIYIVFNSSILKLGTYTQLQHLEGGSPGGGNVLLKLTVGDVHEGNCPSGEMSVRGDVQRGEMSYTLINRYRT